MIITTKVGSSNPIHGEMYSIQQYVHLWRGVLDTTLCDKVCQRIATGRWFSSCTPLSFTNKADRHDITEILLKVALSTITSQKIGNPKNLKVFGIKKAKGLTC